MLVGNLLNSRGPLNLASRKLIIRAFERFFILLYCGYSGVFNIHDHVYDALYFFIDRFTFTAFLKE